MFNLFLFKKIHTYSLIEFLKILFTIIISIFFIVFIIDFLEFTKQMQKNNLSMSDSILIVLYRIPDLIETMFQFIILMASIFTLTKLSITNELTIMYSSRISLWLVLLQQIIFAFIFGIVMLFFLNPFFSDLKHKSELLELKLIEKEESNYIESTKGIWFNQTNTEKTDTENKIEDYIFRADRVYLDSMIFKNVIVLILDNYDFYQKLSAETMYLNENNQFILHNVYIIEAKNNIKFLEKVVINTKLTKKFLTQKIQNEYQDIKSIPFIELNKMITNFKESGLDISKFNIKKYHYVLTPFIYVLMILISGVFVSVNNRVDSKFLNIGKTILVGLFVFISQQILFELGSANILSIFQAIFLPFILIYIAFIVILINKIDLYNTKNMKKDKK